MTITRSIGPGGTFPDINSGVADVVKNHTTGGALNDHVVGQIKKGGLRTRAPEVIAGWSPGRGGFTTRLESAPGEGFRDHPSVLENALTYNAENGAFID